MSFFYQHGIEACAEKFEISVSQAAALAKYAKDVGNLQDKDVVKVLWAAKSPSVKELLKLIESIPEPPEDAEALDPFDVQTHSRNTVQHSPQSEPAGSQYGLFSVPAGESAPSSGLQ